MMEWFRWFENSTTDPKFAVVARRTGQPVAFVIAVWAQLLERASASGERGCIDGYDCEGADVSLGLPDGAACAIVAAMKDKGLIDEYRVCKWDQRQPKREDGSAERAKGWRERKKAEKEDGERKRTLSGESERKRTTANASERTRTQPNAREEEIREEKKEERKTDASHLAQSDAGASSAPVVVEPEAVAYIPLADGTEFGVPASLAAEFSAAYPGVDVQGELTKARLWSLSNPKQRKTRNGVKRFLNSWLDRAQNNASRSSPVQQRAMPMTARQAETAERGDFSRQILAMEEAFHGNFADFGDGTGQDVCAVPATEAGQGRIRGAGQDVGRRA